MDEELRLTFQHITEPVVLSDLRAMSHPHRCGRGHRNCTFLLSLRAERFMRATGLWTDTRWPVTSNRERS